MTATLHRSFRVLAFTSACMAALLGLLPAAGHDQLWFLLMGSRWLHGATLYGPEIFDSNPPLVIWLSAFCVKAAGMAHLEPPFLAKLLVLLLGASVLSFAFQLLPCIWRSLEPGEPAALLFAAIVLFFALPARDLGQRDALAVLLALPYILVSARPSNREISAVSRFAAAGLAAIAFCLKPQDALIAVAVEVTCFLRVQREATLATAVRAALRRRELPVLFIAAGLYLLAIRQLAPLYLTNALPILHSTYWAIGGLTLPALLLQAIELTILTVATLTLFALTRPTAPAATALLAAGLGAFAAYLMQGTGWYYQQLPALDLVGAALALHLLDLQRRRPVSPPGWVLPALTGLCVLAVALTTHFSGYPFTRTRAFALSSPDPTFFRALAPGSAVAILTTSVDEAMMPVEAFHLTWAQRTNNLWLLPAILFSESPAQGDPPRHELAPETVNWLDHLQHRWMVEDLTRWQPALVLVERCEEAQVQCQILEARHDNLLAWFKRDPAFRTLWTRYRFTARRGRFDAYTRMP